MRRAQVALLHQPLLERGFVPITRSVRPPASCGIGELDRYTIEQARSRVRGRTAQLHPSVCWTEALALLRPLLVDPIAVLNGKPAAASSHAECPAWLR